MFFWDRIKKLEERVKELERKLEYLNSQTVVKVNDLSGFQRNVPMSEVIKMILDKEGMRLRYVYAPGSHYELEKKPKPYPK